MTLPAPDATGRPEERDDDLLTRAEASAYLLRFDVRLKPGTLARIWSVGADGPPRQHIRAKPFHPRGPLRDWQQAQRRTLRRTRTQGPSDSPGARS